MDLKRTVTLVLLTLLIMDVIAENGEKRKGRRKKKKYKKKWKSKAKMDLLEEIAGMSTTTDPAVGESIPASQRNSLSEHQSSSGAQ